MKEMEKKTTTKIKLSDQLFKRDINYNGREGNLMFDLRSKS